MSMFLRHPIAAMTLATGETIRIELFPEFAPNTVNSFIALIQSGAYNHRAIKRIVPEFVIQPSFTSFDKDPQCDYLIEGEFRANGFDNPLTLSKYTVAMGGDGETLASGSCFFIAVGECEARLDGKYAGFGRVISGFEVLDRLQKIELISVPADIPGVVINEPQSPEVIESITIETFGQLYPEPKKTEGILAYERQR